MNGDGECRLWQFVQADSQPKSSGLVLGRRPLGAVLHSSDEAGELSQWLCHKHCLGFTKKILLLVGGSRRLMKSAHLVNPSSAVRYRR